jgi:hypothetical protein
LAKNPTPAEDLNAVQALCDKKQYDAAHTSFNALSDTAKTTFEGQLLLCRIESGTKGISASDLCV